MLCRKSWILETPLFRNHSSVISLLYDPLNKRKQLTDLVKKSSTPALTSVSTTLEMKSKWPEIIVLTVLAISVQLSVGFGFGKSDKVLLEDVKTLTLYNNRMTTGKRSSPVPQMKCVGGSAGCNAFSPQVVQCSNKGSDGYDVQWECKTDMDNAYRFGMIEVICEGYDYPDDKYILKGSCGLEYTLDYTKEGMNQGKQQHNYYGDSSGNHYQDNHHDYNSGYASKRKSSFSDWIMLAICGLIIYGIYKSCMSSGHTGYPLPNTLITIGQCFEIFRSLTKLVRSNGGQVQAICTVTYGTFQRLKCV
ncbi:putative store-operated calcium entry-associated regulatory factor-like [Apostichopus japonicus]|uniref:Store-operated calcium entry-associated regulatory factor n=1 Tax=Stichopus japonicus TaxID=307972 RepID=A0A2G8KA78_STIJA|nr:putative store-operated calcium entry-associated regulatory factor-like [Apostichopus japonicus]